MRIRTATNIPHINTVALLAISVLLTVHGCAAQTGAEEGHGEQPSDGTSRGARALAILEGLGIDTGDAEFHVWEGMELLRIDGDMNFDVQGLLDGDYDDVLSPERLLDKAYKSVPSGDPVSIQYSNSIKLTWGAGGLVPGPAWTPSETDKTRYRNAAAAWSFATFGSQTADDLSIRESNTGISLTVYRVPNVSWHGTPCGFDAVACADVFPNGSTPARRIFFRQTLNVPGCSWTTSTMAFVARHELGHAIGLTHPGFGGHQSGTLACEGVDDCDSNPPYATVMRTGVGKDLDENCNLPSADLQPDDLDAVTTIY